MKDKKLFVRDLCARLPYGVKLNVDGYDGCWELTDIGTDSVTVISEDGEYLDFALSWDGYRPYLRPMLSMTAEEEKEFLSLKCGLDVPDLSDVRNLVFNTDSIDWLNEHHFDYRGLVKRGLALEAPEGVYGKK